MKGRSSETEGRTVGQKASVTEAGNDRPYAKKRGKRLSEPIAGSFEYGRDLDVRAPILSDLVMLMLKLKLKFA